MMPWKLVSGDGYIFVWLIGYAALLGPVAGIMIVDFFFIRKRRLDADALYSMDRDSSYWYANGFNLRALIAFAVGAGVCLPGFLVAVGPRVVVRSRVRRRLRQRLVRQFLRRRRRAPRARKTRRLARRRRRRRQIPGAHGAPSRSVVRA